MGNDLSIFEDFTDAPSNLITLDGETVLLPDYLVAHLEGGGDLFELPDGVYIDLPPPIYFRQRRRLGSSDLIRLYKHREGWWWQSPYNPLLKGRSTSAQNYGSALHVRLLEGESEYFSRFAVQPDPANYPGVLVKTEELRAALEANGWTAPTGISKWKLEDWEREAEAMLPADRFTVWGSAKSGQGVMGAFTRTVRGKALVSADEDLQLKILVDAAMHTETPEGREVAQLLASDAGRPAMAEVSILFTCPMTRIRRRARIDRAYPAFDMDLKSTRGHWAGRSLEASLDDVIKKEGYDIQRADYHTARRMLYAFLALGMGDVHGGTDEQRDWLATWPQQFPRWDWVWLFYQKPDMVEGRAPVIMPLRDEPRSDYHVRGLRKGLAALRLFQECVHRYGLGDLPDGTGGASRPWIRVEPTHYTDQDMIPHILVYPDNSPEAVTPVDREDEFLGG